MQISPETRLENLDMSPHIASQLAAMVSQHWRPTPAEIEQLLPHLVLCVYCQLALEALITQELENDLSDEENKILRELLTRLTTIIHETQTPDDFAAYLDILEAEGQDAARRKLPLLAEHLKRCKVCHSTIEETRTLLHRAEEAGLIAPLAAQTSIREQSERH